MANFSDITSKKFNKLTVISYNGRNKDQSMWNCICDCGKECLVSMRSLKTGNTKSCGCLFFKAKRLHGYSSTSEYHTWISMKRRCLNLNDENFHNYGGRGITVCDRWLESFENFLEDMKYKPFKKAQIDRINNNLGYFKENCKWSTSKEQNNNKRCNRKVLNIKTNEIYNSIKKASESTNINYYTLWGQLNGKNKNKTNLRFL